MPSKEFTNPNNVPDLEPIAGEPGWYSYTDSNGELQTIHESELGSMMDYGDDFEEWEQELTKEDQEDEEDRDFDHQEKENENNTEENEPQEPDNPQEQLDSEAGDESSETSEPETNPELGDASEGLPESAAEGATEGVAEGVAEGTAEVAAEAAAETAVAEAAVAEAAAVETAAAAAGGEGLLAAYFAASPWSEIITFVVIFVVVIVAMMSFSLMGYGTESAYGDTNTFSCPSTGCKILDVPYINQFTTDLNTCPVTGPTRWDHQSKSGCGITSQAMVESFILGQKVTPDDIYYGRGVHQGAAQGIYLEMGSMNSVIKSKNIQYAEMTISTLDDAEAALKKAEEGISAGYPSISHTWPPFAHTYHIMVVVGFKENGDIYINDPNCGPTAASAYLEFTVGTGKNRLAKREEFKKAMLNRPFKYPVINN